MVEDTELNKEIDQTDSYNMNQIIPSHKISELKNKVEDHLISFENSEAGEFYFLLKEIKNRIILGPQDNRTIFVCSFCDKGPCTVKTPQKTKPKCPYGERVEGDFMFQPVIHEDFQFILSEIMYNKKINENVVKSSFKWYDIIEPIEKFPTLERNRNIKTISYDFLIQNSKQTHNNVICSKCGEKIKPVFYYDEIGNVFISESYIIINRSTNKMGVKHPKCFPQLSETSIDE
jgi:hypothetical protein